MGTVSKKQIETGSDVPDEPVFFPIGRLQKAHGINGEIKFNLSVNFPLNISIGSYVFIGSTKKRYKVRSMRGQSNPAIVLFEGITDKETVQKLTNKIIYVRLEQLPQQDDSNFYFHEVLGMEVRNESGEKIGTIREIIETGANDVYVIDPGKGEKEILIPAIQSVVRKVDRKTKIMVIRLMKWN